MDWQAYFAAAGIEKLGDVNVGKPAFFEALSDLAKTTPMADWTSYAQWHLARTYAPVTGEAFTRKSVDFYGKTLADAPEIEAQNKRVIATIDRTVGEPLSAKFRILGPLGNLPEFSAAFGRKGGDKMTRFASHQVTVW